jgi:hypothetical protein
VQFASPKGMAPGSNNDAYEPCFFGFVFNNAIMFLTGVCLIGKP